MSAQAAKVLRWLPGLRRWPRPTYPLGLRARIAILVSSGLLALIAIFVVLALSALKVSNEREIQQKAALAQMVAGSLDSTFTQVAALESWAASEIATTLASADPGGVASAMGNASRRMTSVTKGLILFGPDGSFLRAEPPSLPVNSFSLSPDLAGELRSGKPSAVGWVRGGESGFALVAVPVEGRERSVVAYLGALVDLSRPALAGEARKHALGMSGLVDVVNREGVVLSDPSQHTRLGPEGHSALFDALSAGKQPTVGTCYDCHATADGTDRRREIMAYAPLETVDWGVVLRQPEAEVMEPNRLLQEEVLALGAGALFFALFMVWLTTRSVLGPILSLTNAARRIADGGLDDPVVSEGSDEVAELGRTLDFMRVRLKHSLQEVRNSNSELNRRVVERTAELERSRDDLQESRDNMQSLIDRLSTLNAIATTLNGSLKLDEVLNEALANALRLTSMESGAIYLVDEQSGELELAAHRGISREAAEVAANLGLSASLCATAAQAGEPLVVENTGRYARGSRSILRAEKMHFMVRLPFKSSGKLLGTICLGSPRSRSFSRAEMDLLTSVGNQIAVAVEKARLYEEVQRKERLRGDLLEKVISAQEDERKRIARELHDETSQALAAVAVTVETAASQCAAGADVSASLARLRTLTRGTLEEVHRLIFDLRPTLLDDLGLIAALRWYVETRLGEAGIRVRLEVAGQERRLDPLIETTLYRVVQEAVNNVVNHSGAQGFVATLVLQPAKLSLTMADDGWGFDLAELAKSADTKRGLGLMGMKERVELLGGTFAIYSELGQGTRITVEVPLESEARSDE